MKPFTNKKGDSYLFVEVPKDAKNFIVRQNSIQANLGYQLKNKSYIGEELPKGNYTIIGLAKDVSEEVAESIVDREIERHPELKLYIDYTEESTRYAYLLKKATESFHSLLQSLGLKTDYTLILKVI